MLKILFSCFSLQNNNDEIINKKPAIIPINNDEIINKKPVIIKHRLTSKQIRRLKRKSLGTI